MSDEVFDLYKVEYLGGPLDGRACEIGLQLNARKLADCGYYTFETQNGRLGMYWRFFGSPYSPPEDAR